MPKRVKSVLTSRGGNNQARREGGSGGVTAQGPGRPDYVNFFMILLSVRRYAMTVHSSQSQRNLKLQSTAEAR